MVRGKPRIRSVDWAVGLAAVALLLLSVGAYLYHWSRLRAIAAEHLRVVVVGPARVSAQGEAEYYIQTNSVTGQPVPAQVELALYSPQAKRLWGHKEKADAAGQLRVRLPAALKLPPEARLEVLAVHHSVLERMEAEVVADPPRYFTRLSTDRPRYAAGEQVCYRSLTLSRYGLLADREFPVRFEILDPRGQPVSGSAIEGITSHAVGNGAFRLPDNADEGPHALVASALDDSFVSEQVTFLVQREPAPELIAAVVLDKQWYLPGQTVGLQVDLKRAAGVPAAGAKLRISAVVDGKTVFEKNDSAGDDGRLEVEFALPEKIETGEGRIEVRVEDRTGRSTITRPLPLVVQGVQVRFHPEGGVLAPELENRVYFTAQTRQGIPLSLRGLLVDNRGNEVALVQTQVKGMGRFQFTPLRGEGYRLRIIEPAVGPNHEPRLPPALSSARVTINTGTKVFVPGEPLEFTLRASQPGLPLVVTGWCRGRLVGQQILVTSAENGDINSVVLPLSPTAGGVIRLVVFDYSDRPPRPLADRLVFRRPARGLNLRFSPARGPFHAGRPAELELHVRDEQGAPAPAVLSVSVVAETELPAPEQRRPALVPDVLLARELPEAQAPPQAGLLSADDRDSAMVLDLLLATGRSEGRHWPADGSQQPAEGAAAEPTGAQRGVGPDPVEPPLLFDNLGAIQSQYEENLAEYRTGCTRALTTLGTLALLASVGLLLAVVMLGLLKVLSGPHLWGSAVGVSICCVAIGAILWDPAHVRGEGTRLVPFTPYRVVPPPDEAPGTSRRPSQRRGQDAQGNNQGAGAQGSPSAPVPVQPGVFLSESGRELPRSVRLDSTSPIEQAAYAAATPEQPKHLPAELIQRWRRGAASSAATDRDATSAPRTSGAAQDEAAGSKPDDDLARYRFPVHRYAPPETAGDREESTTLYWDPLLKADEKGRAVIRFQLPEQPAAFRVLVEAHSGGRIGSASLRVVSQSAAEEPAEPEP